ncbi:ecotin [Enterobacter ludwigii]|nr:ecotin [Enterobacter ludwigii]
MLKSIVLYCLLMAFSGLTGAVNSGIKNYSKGFNEELLDFFPETLNGMKRRVIYLPSRVHENKFKVELLIGENKRTDCNRYTLNGKLVTRFLTHYGYRFIQFEKIIDSEPAQVYCVPGDVSIAFMPVTLGIDVIQPYNSHMPLVIYVPDEFDVKYRIWNVKGHINKAKNK